MPKGGEAAERKVMVLTGASGRLGRALCEEFAKRYDIVAVSRTRRPSVASNLQSFVDPLQPNRKLSVNEHPVFELHVDLALPQAIERVVEVTMARHGRVDVLVNAAGLPGHGWLLAGGMANAERVMRVNALAPVELAARFADVCWRHDDLGNKERNRCVVNVSSAAAVAVATESRTAVFAASKAALNLFTAHLASELEPFGVRAAAVAPVDFPAEVSVDRVVAGVNRLIEGDETGRLLLVWSDGDELV